MFTGAYRTANLIIVKTKSIKNIINAIPLQVENFASVALRRLNFYKFIFLLRKCYSRQKAKNAGE